MAAEWYYRTTMGRVEGPLTAARLKELARLGEIGPETDVQKGTDGRWIKAIKWKGLIEPAPSAPARQPAHDGDEKWEKFIDGLRSPAPRLQPVDNGDGFDPAPHRPKPPASPIPTPAVDEGDANDHLPVPAIRTAPSDIVDTEYTVTSPAEQRSPVLLVGTGAAGTLLVVGLAVVAFSIFGKKDGNKQQNTALDVNETQKVALIATKNDPHAGIINPTPSLLSTPKATAPSLSTPKATAPSLSTPEATVKGYLAAATWEERLPFVLNADQVRPEMAEHYRDTPRFKAENFLPGTIVDAGDQNAAVGATCIVTVDISTSLPEFPRWSYILVRTPEGFKIDWKASNAQIKIKLTEALQAKPQGLNPVIDVDNEYVSFPKLNAALLRTEPRYQYDDATGRTTVSITKSICQSVIIAMPTCGVNFTYTQNSKERTKAALDDIVSITLYSRALFRVYDDVDQISIRSETGAFGPVIPLRKLRHHTVRTGYDDKSIVVETLTLQVPVANLLKVARGKPVSLVLEKNDANAVGIKFENLDADNLLEFLGWLGTTQSELDEYRFEMLNLKKDIYHEVQKNMIAVVGQVKSRRRPKGSERGMINEGYEALLKREAEKHGISVTRVDQIMEEGDEREW